jgi:hypothetical protein
VEGRGRSQMEARHKGSKWSPGGSVDQWSHISITKYNEKQDPDPDPDPLNRKAGSGSAFNGKA